MQDRWIFTKLGEPTHTGKGIKLLHSRK